MAALTFSSTTPGSPVVRSATQMAGSALSGRGLSRAFGFAPVRFVTLEGCASLFRRCRPDRRVASVVWCSRQFPFPDDTAKADMAGRGVDRLGVARRRAVAAAIIRCAEVRAALQNLAWNANVGLARVMARIPPARRAGSGEYSTAWQH